ncbi:hypothetical protein ACFLS8_01725 [Chloroflexota bacterium]
MRRRVLWITICVCLVAVFTLGCGETTPTTEPIGETWETANPVTMIYACSAGTTHGSFVGLTPYFEKLDEVSGGKFKTRVFPGGVLASSKTMLPITKDALCDSSHVITTYFSSELPATLIIGDCAGSLDNAVAATGATCEMFALYGDLFKDECMENNVYIFGAYATRPYVLHAKDKPVTTLADMEGLKIRSGGPLWTRMGDYLGAIPVSIPASESYEGLARGTIDAAWSLADYQRSYSYWDITPYVTYGAWGCYNASAAVTFRRDWFDEQPIIAKKTLLENFAMVFSKVTIDAYIAAEDKTMKQAIEKGTQTFQPAPDLEKAIGDFHIADRQNLVAIAMERGVDKALAENIIDTYLNVLFPKWVKLAEEEIGLDSDKFTEVLNREVYYPLMQKMGLK